MGVCTAERPVMHWQQSARFLCPPRERSPTLPGHHLIGQCGSSVGNNNHPLYRPCASCPEPLCEHITSNTNNNNSINATHSRKAFGQSPTFNDSCRSFETPERTIFDESPLGFTDLNRGPATDCNDMHSSRSCLQLKTEPLQGPSSPESNSDLLSAEDCAGCGRLIQDRFYLSAVEKRWHVGCLQCYLCKQPLEGETSCFSRDGKIYCKTDYYRVFGTRRCSECMASISSSELVMRARHLVFHVRCFSCTVCKAPLTKGDQFGMRESSVFCRIHYEMTVDSQHTGPNNIAQSAVNLPMSCQYPTQFGASPNAPASPTTDGTGGLKIGASNFFATSAHNITGLPQAPRQKGRPRKRKPKDIDIGMTANLDLNSEYLSELGYGRGGLGSSSRTKRMRTSFKHHQLRTMKSYFAINHNPDAKDLKALSQKTGLPKRVLQVWFQNARAKWRRMMMKQEGKGSLSDKGDGALDLDSYNSHSPSFMMTGANSPHSMD